MAGEPGIDWLPFEMTVFVHLHGLKGKFFVNMILLSDFFFLFNFLRHSGLEAHIEMCRTRLKYERKEINQKMNSEVLSSFRQHAAAVIPPFSSSSYLLFAPRPSSSLSLQGDISSRHNSAGEGCVLDSSSSYSIKDCLDFQISLR